MANNRWTDAEWEERFDVLYNNITSNQAPGLNTHEKCVFLTKGQSEVVKNYFLPQSNPKQAGFDGNQKRQADFSCLMKVANCDSVTGGRYICTSNSFDVQEFDSGYFKFYSGGMEIPNLNPGIYTVSTSNTISPVSSGTGTYTVVPTLPYSNGTFIKTDETASSVSQIDERSKIYTYPDDVYITINESVKSNNGILQVIPLRYDKYTTLMSKPYKRPLKNQAWRLINSGNITSSSSAKCVELIVGPTDTVQSYTIRYIRRPKPIIIGSLDGLTIDGYQYGTNAAVDADPQTTPLPTGPTYTSGCELDPMLYEEILQRAVELAKVAWTSTGQDNAQMVLQAGQRSE